MGELINIRAVAVEQRMAKMCTIENAGSFVYQTDIKVGGSVISAEYHIAYNTDAGDNTYFEFGILRFGYNIGTIEKYVIKERSSGFITLNFSINAKTNTVEIKPSTNVGFRGYLIYV